MPTSRNLMQQYATENESLCICFYTKTFDSQDAPASSISMLIMLFNLIVETQEIKKERETVLCGFEFHAKYM